MALRPTSPTPLGQWYDPNTAKKTGFFWYIPETRSTAGFFSITNPRHRDGSYRSGYLFVSAKVVLERIAGTSAFVRLGGNPKLPQYQGNFVLENTQDTVAPPSTWVSNMTNQQTALANLGAEAYNMLRPDLPDFSAAQTVLELKDFVNPLKNRFKTIRSKVAAEQAKRKAAKRSLLSKTGRHWLSIQFGYLPLIRDTINFIKAHKTGMGRVEQLIRDSGRPVRRRRELKDYSGESQISYAHFQASTPYLGGFGPSFVTQCYGGGLAHDSTRRHKETKVWAEGRFRYFLPPGPRTVQYKKKLFRKVIGANLDIDTVYNLIPWTWMVDYFVDLGHFVQAMSPGVSDRLVADYCYVMSETKWVTHTIGTQYVLTSQDANKKPVGSPVTASARKTYTLKMRVQGSPFGFGVKQSNLSPMQLSILGAVGLSRLP